MHVLDTDQTSCDYLQWRIQNLVKHLRWRISQKQLTAFGH